MKILWTDGSASPNPGPGGFSVIEELPDGSGQPVRIGKETNSTNIRMEGFALKAAMEYAGSEECEIHTDSEFWINVLTKWAISWQANGWRKSKGEIANLPMVKELYSLYTQNNIKLIWTRGHVGTPLNEMADYWANQARQGAKLPEEASS